MIVNKIFGIPGDYNMDVILWASGQQASLTLIQAAGANEVFLFDYISKFTLSTVKGKVIIYSEDRLNVESDIITYSKSQFSKSTTQVKLLASQLTIEQIKFFVKLELDSVELIEAEDNKYPMIDRDGNILLPKRFVLEQHRDFGIEQ